MEVRSPSRIHQEMAEARWPGYYQEPWDAAKAKEDLDFFKTLLDATQRINGYNNALFREEVMAVTRKWAFNEGKKELPRCECAEKMNHIKKERRSKRSNDDDVTIVDCFINKTVPNRTVKIENELKPPVYPSGFPNYYPLVDQQYQHTFNTYAMGLSQVPMAASGPENPRQETAEENNQLLM